MTTINPNIGSNFTNPGASGTGSTDATDVTQTLARLAGNPQLLKELADMAGMLATSKTVDTGGDEVSDSRGAPAIGDPEKVFSQDDMVSLLRSLRGKSQDAQLEAAKNGIENAQVQSEKNTESQLKKIEEWVKKCEEANKSGFLGKLFSWIGKIFAVIASAIAVAVAGAAAIASGGAATPLLALAIMAMVGSTISLADQISQECGGPNISIGNLIGTITSKFLEACGVDAETASKIGKVMAGVAAIAMPAMLLIEPGLASTMATGICELAGADPKVTGHIAMAIGIAAAVTVGIVMAVASGGSSAGTAAVSTATRVSNGLISAGSQIANGATQIGAGVVGIQKAKLQNEAEKALADKKELAADMLKLQQTMEDGREEIKKVIQQIEDGLMNVTKMINDSADSMSQITANMGKRMSV